MKFRRLAACTCVFWSISAVAQLSGEFYLEKTTFASGEPVFLYFKLSNNGPDTVEIVDPDPEQPFCSGVLMKVSKDPPDPSTCPIWADQTCEMNGLQDRLSPLLPGKSRIDRYLLNYHHEISTAGAYRVEATRFDVRARAVGEVHAKLYFHVDGDVPAFPPSIFSHGSTNSNRPMRKSVWKPRALWRALHRHLWKQLCSLLPIILSFVGTRRSRFTGCIAREA